jgi:HEPN domain-containing protein
MPLDEARTEETTAWFAKAGGDLRAATVDLDADPPLAEDALFHCQQAVEKALKGFLTWHDQPFRKTHSLVELGMQCVEIEPDLEPLLREAAKLSEYATRYRYPGEAETAVLEEATEALKLAQEVVEQALARLPDEVRP